MDSDRDFHKARIEAALFLSDEPLSFKAMANLIDTRSITYVKDILEELRGDLSPNDRGITLQYKKRRALLCVKPPHIESVAHLAPQQDIPRPVLRTLAMIAYNNPMRQADLVKARGNKAYNHVGELIDRRLVRAEKEGRTLLLHVTDEFLRYFDLDSPEDFRLQVKPTTLGQ